MVKFLDLENETVKCGSPYNFAMLNNPETGHLGKMLISPNWWNQFWLYLWFWNKDRLGYLITKFQTWRRSNFRDTIETVSNIYVEETCKLGLPVPGDSLHSFQKRSTLDSSHWRDISFYPIRSEIFQVLKIMVSMTNPRSASSETRTDISNW